MTSLDSEAPEAERSKRIRVAIAGATGFVGRALVERLTPTHDMIALARKAPRREGARGIEWRECDLFNLRDAERALAGADIAVYLVHSMMPSAHLTQGRFDDLDLICADNFARAAESGGVKRIVYLGGLLPTSRDALSRHLESRFEVERTLASRGANVTTLRAGLILGAGGSSFDMMAKLVGRLPFMLGPQWTRSLTQPIALDDAVTLLKFAIDRADLGGRAYDIAGPDVVTYADMLRMTGAAQGKNVRVLTLPIQTMKLSLLWVSAITGASQALVRPLVESLRHDMVATDGLTFQNAAKLVARPLRDALAQAVSDEVRLRAQPKTRRPARSEPHENADKRVCSVQRLRVRPQKTATDVATSYVAWLPRFLRPFLRVVADEARNCDFFLWPIRAPLLTLTFVHERSAPDRQLFLVAGGLLARSGVSGRPRLEFRTALEGACVIAAIHDFVPRLPWFVYKYTQALVHLFVMRAFARHLAREIDEVTPAGSSRL